MKDPGKSKRFVRVLKWIGRVLIAQLILINISAAFHAYHLTHYYTDEKVRNQQSSEGKFFLRTWRMMIGRKLSKSVIQYYPSIPYDTVNLTTSEGLKLESWIMEADSSIGSVILFHGLNSNKGNVLGEAFSFLSMNYNVMLVDIRAHGNSQGKINSIGFKESEEVKLAFDYLTSKGEKNIVLWGMSLGAVMICKAVWQYDIKPRKIIIEMPFDRLQDHVAARARISGFPGEPFGFFVSFWTGLEQGYWAYGHRTSKYVKKISCPVLMQWGAKDDYVLKRETEKIYKSITAPDKKLVIYDDAGHGPLVAVDELKWNKTVNEFLAD